MSFSCPLLPSASFAWKNSYICPLRHQFDMAKEGHVNLLPVQHKRSRDPGDSAKWCKQRRAFLDAGHYQPLRDAICRPTAGTAWCKRPRRCWILAVVKGITRICWCVARNHHVWSGCLEGSDKSGGETLSAGHFLCVASSHRLPFSDTSMDAICHLRAV